MSTEHRNIRQKKFCPACEHYHPLKNTLNPPTLQGICLKEPPQPFMVGMAQVQPAIAREGQQIEQVPIMRAFFPPVGDKDTCGQWTARAEGEA